MQLAELQLNDHKPARTNFGTLYFLFFSQLFLANPRQQKNSQRRTQIELNNKVIQCSDSADKITSAHLRTQVRSVVCNARCASRYIKAFIYVCKVLLCQYHVALILNKQLRVIVVALQQRALHWYCIHGLRVTIVTIMQLELGKSPVVERGNLKIP